MRSLNVFTKKFRYSLFLLPFVMHVPLNSLFCIFIVSYFTLFGKMALQPLHMPRVIVVAFNIYYSSTRWRGFSSHRFRRIWNTVKLWVVSRRRWKKMFKFALVSHFSWWLAIYDCRDSFSTSLWGEAKSSCQFAFVFCRAGNRLQVFAQSNSDWFYITPCDWLSETMAILF